MKPKSPALPIIAFALSGLCFTKAFMIDLRPKELQFVNGPVGDREPIYSKGLLRGVQFTVGDPAIAFTYRDPDPDAKLVWSRIQTARTVRIGFEPRDGGRPVFWELAVDGQPVLTPTAFEGARRHWFWLHFWIASIFGGIGVFTMLWWVRSRAPWGKH